MPGNSRTDGGESQHSDRARLEHVRYKQILYSLVAVEKNV